MAKLTHQEVKALTALAQKAAKKRASFLLGMTVPSHGNVQLLHDGGAVVEAQIELTEEDLLEAFVETVD